jgi:hypothetical protein
MAGRVVMNGAATEADHALLAQANALPAQLRAAIAKARP